MNRTATLLSKVISMVICGLSLAGPVQAQTANTYAFTTGTGATLDAMSGAVNLIGINIDDTPVSAVTNIGFTFNYEGTAFTQFSVNPNGLVKLGSAAVSGEWSNSITSTADVPKLMPFWDDQNTGSTGGVTTVLSGSSPNQIRVVQWRTTIGSSSGSAFTQTYQLWLYQTSNVVEFRYGTGNAGNSASVGIGGAIASNYLSVTTSAHTAVNSSANNSNTTWPGSGRRYTFTPAAGGPCSSITALTCGTATSYTFPAGTGSYNPPTTSCGFSTPGMERVYSFTPAVTGNYTISQPTSFGYIDYFYKAASGGCSGTGWSCIDDITNGNVGNGGVNIPLTSGTAYYFLLDPESTGGGTVTFTLNCASDPCSPITALAACGTTQSVTLAGGGANWSVTSCGFTTPGQERVYTYTPPTTGTYTLEVTSSSGSYIDYFWKLASGGCSSSGWSCINDVSTASVVTSDVPMAWTAGVPVLLLLDAESTSSVTHTFRLNCPPTPPSCVGSPTAPANGATGIATTGTTLSWATAPGSTGYDVYFGTTNPAPTLVSSNQAGLTYSTGALSGSTTYYWRIVPRNGAGPAAGCTNWSFTTAAGAPGNDNCSNAIAIASLPYMSPVINNALATDDSPTSSCDGPYKNVWWTVTGICGTMTAITCTGSTNFDDEISVFTSSGGCSGPWTQVACNDDNGAGCTNNYAGVSWTSTAGTIYYITVGSYFSSSSTGNLQLNVTATPFTASVAPTGVSGTTTITAGGSTSLTATGGTLGTGAAVQWFTGSCGGTLVGTGNPISLSPVATTTYYVRYSGTCNTTGCATVTVSVAPANDACTNAIGIASLPYSSAVISNASATDDNVGTGCGGGPYKNIWWTVTGICGTMTASTCNTNSNFDAEIHVYTGTCGALAELTCNDDAACAFTVNSSTISWTATAGTLYYISAGSYFSSSATGNLQLDVSGAPFTPSVAPTGISGTTTVCEGTGGTTLTATGGTLGTGAVVEWYTGSCGGIPVFTGNPYNANPASTTTYFARYNGTCNSTTCASVTVWVNTLPTASATGGGTVCSTDPLPNVSFILTGTGPWDFTYSGPGGTTVTGHPTSTYTITNAAAGTYAVTAVSDANCIGTSFGSSALVAVDPATTWYEDTDGDSFGDPASSTQACAQPPGYVAISGDGCPSDPNKQVPGACGCGVPDTNTDGDAAADCNDVCPTVVNGNPGDPCNDGNANTFNDVLGAGPGCACAGTACTASLILEFQLDGVSTESWEIRGQGTNTLIQSGMAYLPVVGNFSVSTCVPNGCFYLKVTDDGGDGMIGGGYVLRTQSNKRIIDNRNNFTSGGVSQIAGNQGWCVTAGAIGNDRLLTTSCDRMELQRGATAACSEKLTADNTPNNTSGSVYQFWVYNPNGPESQLIPATGAGSNILSMNQITLPAGKVYNVKVRTRVSANVYRDWGPACRMSISTGLPCRTTKLVDDPSSANWSCGKTVILPAVGGSNSAPNMLVAKPATRLNASCVEVAANKYQFRIKDVDTQISTVVSGLGSNYYCYMTQPSFGPCRQYEVDVRASFDNGATWCNYSDVCTVYTGGCLWSGGENMGTAGGDLHLYPNPNRGEQVMLRLENIGDPATVSVDIYDAFGKRVMARTLAAQDGFVDQPLELKGILAAGLYVVSITAGGTTYIERLVIEP